jgi:hypothetical protein
MLAGGAITMVFRLRYVFDAGSGICLWADNNAARERFGYPVDVDDLPISPATRGEIARIVVWFDESIDWDDPSVLGPSDDHERRRFEQAAHELLSLIRTDLGDSFEVVDGTRSR